MTETATHDTRAQVEAQLVSLNARVMHLQHHPDCAAYVIGHRHLDRMLAEWEASDGEAEHGPT